MNRLLTAALIVAFGLGLSPVLADAPPSGRDPAHIHYSQGVALLSAGDLVGAITELRLALLLKPDMAHARFSLATALYQSGDLDRAIAAYRATLRLQPDLAHAHLHLGTALLAAHDWKGALAELQAAAGLLPDSALAQYSLGLARDRLGDTAGAVTAYREALRLRPAYPDAHYHLGRALKAAGQDADATREFLAAAEAGVVRARYFVGAAYASGTGVERNLVSAISWWVRGVEEEAPDARDALAHLHRMAVPSGARSLGEARIVQDAFGEFRRALWKEHPDLRGAVDQSLGSALLQQGRAQEAVPVLIREALAMSEEAQTRLAALYADGVPDKLARHDRRILGYLQSAADEGLAHPRVLLARILAQGLGVPPDANKALALLKGNPREDAKALAKELSAAAKDAATSRPRPAAR
jgi:tetratricopeptide (TPR) repeat protein